MPDPWIYPDYLDSQYFSFFDLPNNQRAYTLTGVAVCTMQGGGGGRWKHERLYVIVPIPGLPGGQGLKLIHWAPFFTLNSISNDGVANDAGWAVDTWDWSLPPNKTENDPLTNVRYDVHCAVGDSDGFVLRVGYNIGLVGQLQPL